MRIAFCSDEPSSVHGVIQGFLEERGHTVVPYGSLRTGGDCDWAPAAEQAALAVARGDCDQGVFCCWTGTGISMAANKVLGVRAALCTDPGTAAGARVWNHANVLCLSNRLLSEDMAKEILTAWLDTDLGSEGADGVALFLALEQRHRSDGN